MTKLLAAAGRPETIPPGEVAWTLAATHDLAAARSGNGPWLTQLHYDDGRLFVGYGSGNTNNTPVDITYLSLADHGITSVAGSIPSEAVTFRTLNGEVWALVNDEIGGASQDFYRESTGWASVDTGQGYLHVQDAYYSPAFARWYVGGAIAVLRQSADLSSWATGFAEISYRVGGIHEVGGVVYAVVFITAVDWTVHAIWSTSDGTTWTEDTTSEVIPGDQTMFARPLPFLGGLVFKNKPSKPVGVNEVDHVNWGYENHVNYFNGTWPASQVTSKQVYDHNVTPDGSTLYVLYQDGEIAATGDLDTLTTVTSAAAYNPRSIAALDDGTVYVGTMDAKIYRYGEV